MVLNVCRIKAIHVLEKAGEHRLTPDNQRVCQRRGCSILTCSPKIPPPLISPPSRPDEE
jgi:hypothetical protein